METNTTNGYLHGYTKEEQARLVAQAGICEQSIYEKIDLHDQRVLLEIGCGVGAQTEILLKRFPQLEIHGLDISKEQINQAERNLAKPISENKVHLKVGDASVLPYSENSFDAVFICWFLEHVNHPLEVLKEVKRVLKPNGVVYCTEVLNTTLYLHPHSPVIMQYWGAFNDHQRALGGDPCIGARLGNYLMQAGFEEISTEERTFHHDSRTPEMRSQMFDHWVNLLLSAKPQLLESQKISVDMIDEMKREFSVLKNAPDSVSFYSYIQAVAKTS